MPDTLPVSRHSTLTSRTVNFDSRRAFWCVVRRNFASRCGNMRSRSSASASSADTAHSQLLLQLADTVAQALSLGHEQLTRAVDEALQFDRDCVEHAGRDAVLAAEHCLVRFRL